MYLVLNMYSFCALKSVVAVAVLKAFVSKVSVANEMAAYISNGHLFFFFFLLDVLHDSKGLI